MRGECELRLVCSSPVKGNDIAKVIRHGMYMRQLRQLKKDLGADCVFMEGRSWLRKDGTSGFEEQRVFHGSFRESVIA
ncbi:MAG: hypothetical protein EOP84_28080 [Verrucomicrobiaceae bacterium]|nr:MAG: hypothetical protein EOP84_28080 [Verrucomicrobiaceae bacterium]